jgi:hypothetical protein
LYLFCAPIICDLISDASSCRHIVNKILNVHAPGNLLIITKSDTCLSSFRWLKFRVAELMRRNYISYFASILWLSITEWSGEVRSIVYSSDGKSVSVVYRVTLYGTDAEVSLLSQIAFTCIRLFITNLRVFGKPKNRWVSEFYSLHLYFNSILMNFVSLLFEKLPAPDKFKLGPIHLLDHCYLYEVPYIRVQSNITIAR